MNISKLANNITTSPILTFAAQVNAKIAQGEQLYNLTVGDFNPHIYGIPDKLTAGIIEAYQNHHTNYPGAFGLDNLRKAIAQLIKHYNNVDLELNNILVASGSRPLIYGTYKSIIDAGDKVVFPVPSWNNDYYSIMSDAEMVTVETSAENNFMPTKDELKPHLKGATLLALCSPQNPTGTVLSKQQLIDICDLVVAENNTRSADEKPLYVMFDQVYWLTAYTDDVFYHAQTVNDEIGNYAIFIDGVSKNFAGTGIRVGWATGPSHIMEKMRAFIAHIGAWAPKAEQFATGEFLSNLDDVKSYLSEFNQRLQTVLDTLHHSFMALNAKGLPVRSIKPEASIYLSIQISIQGKTTADGKKLESVDDVHTFLLEKAKVAVLPFSWFGAHNCNDWFRISIGTCPENEAEAIVSSIEQAINSLSD